MFNICVYKVICRVAYVTSEQIVLEVACGEAITGKFAAEIWRTQARPPAPDPRHTPVFCQSQATDEHAHKHAFAADKSQNGVGTSLFVVIIFLF